MNKNIIDIIIISYNTRDLVLDCIKSAIQTAYSIINQIILVDNNSSDGTTEAVREAFPSVIVIENEINRGFAAAVNQGFAVSDAEFVFIANTDVIFHDNTIELLSNRLKEKKYLGIVGGQQVFPNGKWQRSYGAYPSVSLAMKDLTFATHIANLIQRKAWDLGLKPKRAKRVDYIDGALMAIRREAYDTVGGFDEAFFFYTEEADFCYGLNENGYEVEFYPSALITHLRGGSSGEVNLELIKKLFETKVYFLEKRYSKAAKRRFVYIEKLHNYIAKAILSLIYTFSFGGFKEKIKRKLDSFEKYCAAWRDILQNS